MDLKKKRKIILISVFALVLVVIILIAMLSTIKPDNSSLSTEEKNLQLSEKISEMKKQDLSILTERDRIENYIVEYINYLQYGKYEKAYELLNSGFKDNFFNDLDSFKTYSKKRFYKNMAVEFKNIEKAGDVYIIWADITNLLGDTSKVDQINFVIKENDLNDYEVSFSVNRK